MWTWKTAVKSDTKMCAWVGQLWIHFLKEVVGHGIYKSGENRLSCLY